MKSNHFYTIVLALLLFSCEHSEPQFDWLTGSWERTNGKLGTQTNESWEKIDNETYKAVSVVFVKTDTVYKEHITIEKLQEDFYYIADVPQNPTPTKFKIVEITDSSFVAVNPEHDFPQEIAYSISNNKLTATILGSDKQIDYNFEKQ